MSSANHLNYCQNCAKFGDEINPFLNGGGGRQGGEGRCNL